ncbi:UNVERIFIED_CONTAM: hypothetical protein K2H54_032788 [Gekko kuhli]
METGKCMPVYCFVLGTVRNAIFPPSNVAEEQAWHVQDPLFPLKITPYLCQGEEKSDENRNKEEKPDPGIPMRKAGRPGWSCPGLRSKATRHSAKQKVGGQSFLSGPEITLRTAVSKNSTVALAGRQSHGRETPSEEVLYA